jgi:outer membrane protein TolC
MRQIGRLSAIIALLLLLDIEPLPCRAAPPPPKPRPAPTGRQLISQAFLGNVPRVETARGAAVEARTGVVATLKPAPLAPTDRPLPINLATALRLSDARPLVVAAAQASVWVAEAQLTRAKVLWVPTFMFGFDYIRHDGGGPDFNKGILTSPSVNFFYGGISFIQNVNLTDAIFEPLASRQMLDSRNWDIQTAKNDALLMTAEAYFNVHQSRGLYASSLYTVERGQELLRRIEKLSKDLVPVDEVARARNMLADLEQQATSSREAWRVSSANLTRVLRLDPRVVVIPLEHDHVQITLIDPSRSIHELQQIALINRPELASRQATLDAATTRIRREKMRPVLPIVQLNGFQSAANGLIQAGIFGMGPNSSMNQWDGRFDTSIQLVWQLEAFGLGNLARIKQQRGMQSQAVVDLFNQQDQVAEEVTANVAHLQSAAARVSQAERSLRTAVLAFNGNYQGLQQTSRFGDVLVLINRPEEVVFALQKMKTSFDYYFMTVAEYNRAQFALFHALGYPANEVTNLHPPGEVIPIDTTRPAFLPPVGNGPPPATR